MLHAPGSLCTYEPQWGSDVFGMYQNLVEGRAVPYSLLVKDMPPEKHRDLDFIVDQIDWDANLDPAFKQNHFLPPIPARESGGGFVDRWICYGAIDGRQWFSAKELPVAPGATCTVRDNGAYGLIVVQGEGRINGLRLSCPALIRFHEMTEDEAFVTEAAARSGVAIESTSLTEPLVILRYFGPDVNPEAPHVGASPGEHS